MEQVGRSFAVAAVDNSMANNARLEIGGPSYSWTEVVAAAGDALGQELPISYVPIGSEVPLLDPMVAGLLNGMETYEDSIDMGDLPAQFDVKLAPLTTVMQRMFKPR